MDRNKNQADLLAAGRKRLQQFRKKKDGKGRKSSAKPSNSDSTSVDKVALVSPELSDRDGSSVNDRDAQNVASSIPISEEHTQATDDPLSDPVIPEADLVTTSVDYSAEMLPEEQVSMMSSVGSGQGSDSFESLHVDSIIAVEESSNNDFENLESVVSEGDSFRSAIQYLNDSSNLEDFVDTANNVSVEVEGGRVDGTDQGHFREVTILLSRKLSKTMR